MSSIIERLRSPGPPPFAAKAPEIKTRLDEAEVALASMESTHGDLALAVVEHQDGAESHLATLLESLAAKKSEVATLRAAYTAALARDDAAQRAARAQLHKTQLAAVKRNLAQRDTAAEALSAAIAEATKQFKIMVDCSEKAWTANPIGGEWPAGAICGFDELRRLVEQELFRFGGDSALGNRRSFPGANALSLEYVSAPEALPPLADTLKQASQYVLATLTGQEPK